MDIGIKMGPSIRLGEAPDLTVQTRTGPAFSVGAWVTPLPRFTFGLSYEYVGLGSEVGGAGNPDFAEVNRALNSVWADLRMHLFRSDVVRLSALIGLGLNWQRADATAAFSQEIGQPLYLIQCSGSDSANFSFRAGLGSRFAIGNGFSFLLDAVLDEVRLSNDPMSNCVLGGGTMTLVSARAGLAYQFDVTRAVK